MWYQCNTVVKISIHALLAESDTIFAVRPYDAPIFLSTLSLRRATTSLVVIGTNCIISIHALLAESDHETYVVMEATKIISIHALLAESDPITKKPPLIVSAFLSTLSLRRATALPGWWTAGPAISIHALLAESDPGPKVMTPERYYFYPRSPCGERPSENVRSSP